MLNYQRVPISKMVIFHIKLLDYLKIYGMTVTAGKRNIKPWVISLPSGKVT